MGSSQLDVSFSGLERYMDESPRSSRVSEKLRYWEPLWLYLYRFCRQRCTVYSFVLYSTVLYSVIILGSWKEVTWSCSPLGLSQLLYPWASSGPGEKASNLPGPGQPVQAVRPGHLPHSAVLGYSWQHNQNKQNGCSININFNILWEFYLKTFLFSSYKFYSRTHWNNKINSKLFTAVITNVN